MRKERLGEERRGNVLESEEITGPAVADLIVMFN